MSESFMTNCDPAVALELPANGSLEAEEPAVQPLAMPFEPESREADALRGAFRFLFTLVTFSGELLEQNANAACDQKGEGDISLNRH